MKYPTFPNNLKCIRAFSFSLMPLGMRCKLFQVPKYNKNTAKGEPRKVWKVEKRPKNNFYKHKKHSYRHNDVPTRC